jgi:hypothetical protein
MVVPLFDKPLSKRKPEPHGLIFLVDACGRWSFWTLRASFVKHEKGHLNRQLVAYAKARSGTIVTQKNALMLLHGQLQPPGPKQ